MDVRNGSSQKRRLSPSKCHMDFFSELPDSILEHILSFLPLKDATQTMLLRRFGDLWRGIRVLDLISCDYHGPNHDPDHFNEKFTNVIRRVLDLHDNSILDRVRLRFCFRLNYTREEPQDPDSADIVEWEARTSAEIEKLIRYAMSRKVKVLDLDLNGDEFVDSLDAYNLPHDVLRSDHLTYLKLVAFDMTSCNGIDLKSLKTLVLENVQLSDSVMEAILLHCPVLEDLTLAFCFGFEVVKCENPKLKKLLLSLKMENSPVRIYCPYVLSLHLSGLVRHMSLMNASSAVDASLCICHLLLSLNKQSGSFFLLMNSFAKCKTFSLCTWSIMVMCGWNLTMPGFRLPHRPSFQWENLTLKLDLTKRHLIGLSELFKNSPSLKTLSIYIYPGYHDILQRRVARWSQYNFGAENFWDSQKATLPRLETITVCGHVDDPYVIKTVGFLLKHATSLQKLVVSANHSLRGTNTYWYVGEDNGNSPKYSAVQLQELAEKLGSLPRASRKAIICFF